MPEIKPPLPESMRYTGATELSDVWKAHIVLRNTKIAWTIAIVMLFSIFGGFCGACYGFWMIMELGLK